ncbi:bone morphogenetic protein 15 [Sceloporus undulatus]|uniref:bone morphogenetic protein 15 n=1 Tax=Sceloporus undulatus TaxID=8520 RepID=UPI001C4B82D5|nr:bone morphogenetic protein 15 [Sceloporus undulatus]
MAGWCSLSPCRALLFLALLLPLETPMGDGEREAPDADGPLMAGPPLPLIQVLLSQAPTRTPGRRRRQAGGPPLRYMMGLYRSVADRHGQPRRNRQLPTNTIRLLRPFAKHRQPGTGPWLVWTLDFRLEVKPPLEHLVRAVAVYSPTQSLNRGLFACRAELLLDRSTVPPCLLGKLRPPPLANLTTNTASVGQDGWTEVDLSAHLQLQGDWGSQQSRVLHLLHACCPLDPRGQEDLVSLNDPFLLLYLNDTRRFLRAEAGGLSLTKEKPSRRRPSLIRRTRQTGRLALDLPSYSPAGGPKQSECSLRPFRVSFSQLGWDRWIIAPHWYRPQYCKGACPRVLRYGYNSPNHAIVQNFINELVDQSVPRPSCVPYKYSPISVLMIEPNNDILYKVYDNMIAKSCTCR